MVKAAFGGLIDAVLYESRRGFIIDEDGMGALLVDRDTKMPWNWSASFLGHQMVRIRS
jgi:hypothetical protein